MTFKIVETQPSHLSALANNLRPDDAREIENGGWGVRQGIWRSYRSATMRKTVLIDGEVAAVYGVGGVVLSGIGTPWLLTTAAVERYPLGSTLLARQELAAMLTMYPVLRNVVDASYHRAVRILQLLGFSMSDPFPFGPKRAMFRRFEMRRS